eukprot:CAMPEP_0171101012 /NCGR_PEP_ID=MMETSP0766_2-20121228/53710_1 /TAXON_ID=439317 /ORGANISM="Gambierdiscus australes, Strain CAWD 149" /LENGTH=118 /DNA_ID=CAMNT_0011560955 /DNA_START=103 /DNA_END=458 /DNA_ORIENTATION=+
MALLLRRCGSSHDELCKAKIFALKRGPELHLSTDAEVRDSHSRVFKEPLLTGKSKCTSWFSHAGDCTSDVRAFWAASPKSDGIESHQMQVGLLHSPAAAFYVEHEASEGWDPDARTPA